MSNSRGRLVELDSLRGIAALSVVLFHSLLTVKLSDSAIHRLIDALPTHPLFAGRMAVIFFFVLSGVVLTRGLMKDESGPFPIRLLLFAARRVVRLCVPVAAVLGLSAGLYRLFWHDPSLGPLLYGGWNAPPDAKEFIRQAFLIGMDGDFFLDPALWSLVHELRFSLVLPFIVAMPCFRGIQGSISLVLAGLVVFGLSLSGHADIEASVSVGSTVSETLRATAYFALPFLAGSALSLGSWDQWQPNADQRKVGLAAALLLLCTNNNVTTVIAAVLLILLSGYAGAYQNFLRSPVLRLLGRISFSLYLVHIPIQLAVQHSLHALLSEASMELLTIALSLLAAWIVNILIEQPAQRLSKKIALPRFTSGSATVREFPKNLNNA